MNWVIESKRIVETEDMLKLKQFIIENDIHCDVSIKPCPWDFWLTKEEKLKQSNAAIGYTCFGSSFPIVDNKDVMIKITIMEKEKFSTQPLDLTLNPMGDTLTPWHRSIIREKVLHYKLGVYKRPGFDNAFYKFKKLNASITEKEFANNITDLVKVKLYDDGHSGCIEVIEQYTYINSDKSNITLNLLSMDIAKNIYFIKGWLLSNK